MDIITLAMSKKSGGGITPEQLAQIEQNKNDISRLSEEKVDQTQLTNAVNNALTKAKESGEFNGSDGQDGKDGEDGYTPQKGTDYFTEEDKQELVTNVLNALPTWTGGAY